jgi:hypothetical protein
MRDFSALVREWNSDTVIKQQKSTKALSQKHSDQAGSRVKFMQYQAAGTHL